GNQLGREVVEVRLDQDRLPPGVLVVFLAGRGACESLADQQAHEVRAGLRVAGPGSVADRLETHRREWPELARQGGDDGGAGRRDELGGPVDPVDRGPTEELERRRRRERQAAVGGIDESPGGRQRGAGELVDTGVLERGGEPGDV